MRKYENVDISKLKPYKNNARTHNEEQVNKIAKSIEEFGFINPVLIDNDYGIIAGHGRVLGAKQLGLEEVPCIFIEDLTDVQKRAYILADNKIAEEAGWDDDILKFELAELDNLDFDISLAGFDKIELELEEDYSPNQRERTDNAYNLDIINIQETDGYYQMPIIKCDFFIPDDLVGFNYARSCKDKEGLGIHFYIDDYQFERIWNAPDDYIEVLSQYQCILSPDFSLYLDMPMAMKIWNVYRSRLIGQYYQRFGIKVIPTISWAEKETFDFCFDGIPEGSIVSISTIGVKQDKRSLQIWKDGVDELIKRIKPSAILVYGGKIDYDYGDIEVIYFDNQVTENMKSSAS